MSEYDREKATEGRKKQTPKKKSPHKVGRPSKKAANYRNNQTIREAEAALRAKQPDPNAAPATTRRNATTNSVTPCGANKANGERCELRAGHGTDHPGFGRCKWHGGNTPSGKKSAQKSMALQRMAAANAYGELRDIGPHEALLEEVQRTSGHVQWLGDKVKTLENESDLTQYTAKDGIKPSEWVAMYQEERKMLVNVCNIAIKAGIAERQVRIAEEQGKIMALAFMKLINDEALGLTPEQRLVAPRLVRNLLLELPQAMPQVKKINTPADIVDAVIVEE